MVMRAADLIRERVHWDVVVRPERHVPGLVPYASLLGVINSATVRMRGWPLPFIGRSNSMIRGDDYIGQDVVDGPTEHTEAWRFFTSGQFAMLRVISADRGPGREQQAEEIEVWEPLFFLTELVELAVRLSSTSAGTEPTVIEAILRGAQGRRLVGENGRQLPDDYVTDAPAIRVARTVAREELITDARQLAVDMTLEVFARFGFAPSVAGTLQDQRELTEE
jgi:hypothetical protein